MRKCTYGILILTLLVGALAWASPDSFTYQGRILKSNGAPLEYNSVSFAFEITNAAGNCTFWQEQKDHVNMQGSSGVFDVPIGSGTRIFPTTPLADIRDAFKNSVELNCAGGGKYTPSETEIRLLKVQFHDGVGWNAITPSSEIRSVPFSTFSYSAAKLGSNLPSDFVLRSAVTPCLAGQYLTYDGTSFTCQNDSGGTGTITDVNVTSPLTKGGTLVAPVLGINVGTTAGSVAAGNDARFGDAQKIHGLAISNAAPISAQYLKYNGTQWAPATIDISEISDPSGSLTGLMKQSAFNAAVTSASCTTNQTMYWNSVSGNFQCQTINITSLDFAKVTGTPNTLGGYGITDGVKNLGGVPGLKSGTNAAKGPATSAGNIYIATDSKEIYRDNGTTWDLVGSASGAGGTVTSVTGTAGQISVSTGTTMPVVSLVNVGTAGSYYKVTTDAQGRVTSGSAALVAADIPALDFSKITTGKPTTLAGYGITDAVKNLGGVPAFKSGTNASKGAGTTAGNIYITTDSNEIYRDNGTTWDLIGSATGAGGTITGVTAGTGLTGGGTTGSVSLAVNVGTGANQIVQMTAAAKLPAVDGSALTNLNPANLSAVVPITKGGTGQTTAVLGFNALSPLAAKGDLITRDVTNNVRLVVGTDGQILTADSTQASGLKWATPTVGTVTSVAGTVGQISVATGTTTPVVSLVNVGTAGSYYKVTTDAQGRVTSGSTALVAADIPALDFSKITTGKPTTLAGYGITDAVKNLGGVPAFKSGTNAAKGAGTTAGNIYITTDSNEIYRDNGATWDLIGSATGAGGTITGVTAGTGLTGGGTAGSVSLAVNVGTGANQVVQMTAAAKLPAVDGSALTNLNPANLSAVVPITKGGTGQVTAVLGFNALSPVTAKGDLITRDATNNIRLAVGTDGQMLTADSLQPGGLKWTTPTVGTVTSVSGTAGQINVATGTTTPVISLPSTGTAGTYYKVTTDAQGRVTSGSAALVAADIPALDYSKITTGKPTTLSGYGITDAVKNLGGVPGLKSGTNATKGAVSAAGNIYIATDTKEIYRDNGTTWDLISSADGSGGTITEVTAGTGLTGGGTTGSVSLAVNVGTGANQIVQMTSGGKLPAVDGSALTNINPANLSAVVPITKGGTGQTTATAAFNALSPTTTKGDLIVRDGTSDIRLGVGTNGQMLTVDSTQASGLKWSTPTVGTVTNVTATAPLSVANGGTTPSISISSGTGLGQVLRWNTTAWASSYFNFADLKSAAGLTQIPNSCTASQTLVWQTPSDTFACTNISVSGTNFAAQSAGLVFAGPTAGSAAPTFRALASSDLPAGTLDGTGTAGYVPYYSDANTLTNSNIFTSSSNIGIGTATPAALLHVSQTLPDGSKPVVKFENLKSNISGLTTLAALAPNISDTYPKMNILVGKDYANYQAGSIEYNYNSTDSAQRRLSIGHKGYTPNFHITEPGKVGIGTTSPPSPLSVVGGAFFGDKATFPTDFSSIETNSYVNSLYYDTATTGNYAAFSAWMRVGPAANSTHSSQASTAGLSFNVPASVTVNSTSQAMWISATRNRYSANVDSGKVESLIGANIVYGHENSVPANTPTTTNAYGVLISPNSATGTITNMYDMYLGTKTAGATITNRYGVYQSDSAATNVFKGRIGIGTTTPDASLDVVGHGIFNTGNEFTNIRLGQEINDNIFADNSAGKIYGGGLWFRVHDATQGSLYRDILYLNDNGRVGIGIPLPTYTLHVNGSVAGTSAYVNLSDERLKNNIQRIPNALAKVERLRGVTYEWNHEVHPELKLSERQELGVIAQEVEAIFPQAVSEDKKTGIKSVAYSMLIGPIIEAIKEIHSYVSQLQTSVSKQDERLMRVENEMNILKEQNELLRKQNQELLRVIHSKADKTQ
ncbi:tail fiber domain-containing protein [Bdellovibrio sp. HCB274]|uniref:tail fiber domain-containing protein n=1 Tax=Bdellovibrio sp. HCB274 TaxID=3394361 RepID=UPI0039B5ABBD